MWRAIGSSVIGSSHQKSLAPCQDACGYSTCTLGADSVLVICIADGAGSAKASDLGSNETVKTILETIASSGKTLGEIDAQIAREWIEKTRERLAALALERGVTTRDLACTVLFAVLDEAEAVFVQIGDGGWIAKTEAGYQPVTWPSRRGEYANETTFITSPDWQEDMQFVVLREPLRGVAGFSDGLQQLALHMASQSVHVPFFETKFQALAQAADAVALQQPLEVYLSSATVNERTDDDKTLVLAERVAVLDQPAPQNPEHAAEPISSPAEAASHGVPSTAR
jgi:hypothetical protein